MEYVLDDATQTRLEQQLVDLRKQDRSIGADTFHKWLVVSRRNPVYCCSLDL